MFLQKNMDILGKRFPINFAETNNDKDTKRKNDTSIMTDQLIPEKPKQHDHLINQQNNDDYLVDIESENDE
ncbi:unnamed protein product [Adineta steineri]|uniref:Uncharacterized protein n=1 Tax=Adineta steineri TaxID=433720 RepID=A0A813SIL5_9BILA|nr:unnamed protein product [Adineta steineri]CAF0876401.1 unnamed protein product [Adineta steineri]CAF0912752.1 unnamed protein product [Adineta steineri]CAF3905799.1 unnamed protein product [Adineta steineri]CAF4127071.1 unnamed protein product [Adineta steineri]